MRQESAASIKRKISLGPRLPRPGTELRALYDRFMANKGAALSISLKDCDSLQQLVNFYGLDIRAVNPPGGRRGVSRNSARGCIYILAGEWVGRVYIDYIAERIKQEEDRK